MKTAITAFLAYVMLGSVFLLVLFYTGTTSRESPSSFESGKSAPFEEAMQISSQEKAVHMAPQEDTSKGTLPEGSEWFITVNAMLSTILLILQIYVQIQEAKEKKKPRKGQESEDDKKIIKPFD